jgi:OOP family OmpA-OmpF porin
MDRHAMKRKAGTVLVLLSPVLLLGIASAQRQDTEGSKDHPILSRMPNFYIYQYDEKEFDRYEFQTSDRKVAIEGHYYSIVYYLQDNSPKTPSNLQIIRNFENAIKKMGIPGL